MKRDDFRKAFDDGKIDKFSRMIGLVYGEARMKEDTMLSERKEYMAIASTVMNRVSLNPRFPDTIIDVILQPLQFSCFNDNDPNATLVWNFITKGDSSNKGSGLYGRIEGMITPVVKEIANDFSNSADHYVALWFYDEASLAHWCRKYPITEMHGGHIFLREVQV